MAINSFFNLSLALQWHKNQTKEKHLQSRTFSLVPRPSPAPFLAAYVTFEPRKKGGRPFSDRGLKVTYVVNNGVGDGLGMRQKTVY